MRKHLVAAVIGAMLIAGQAAASASGIANPPGAASQLVGTGGVFLTSSAAMLAGMVSWGLSAAGYGAPASP